MLNYSNLLKKLFNPLKRKYVITSLLACAGLLQAPQILADVYSIAPGQDVVGEVRTTHSKYEDTFLVLAHKFDVAYRELIAANPGVDPWVPGAGTKIIIPSQYILPSGPREGIIINLAELRIYFFNKSGTQVYTYPIAIGAEGTPTPLYSGRVTSKEADPTWYVPDSIYEKHIRDGDPVPRVVPAGEANPLGKYAVHISLPGYLIHGTNRPFSVGQRISNGCIRLYPEDIQELFAAVTPGAPIRIIHEPYKTGWDNGELLLEAHTPLSEYEMAGDKRDTNLLIGEVDDAIKRHPVHVNWQMVKQVSHAQTGIPTPISDGGPSNFSQNTSEEEAALVSSN